MCTTNSPPTLLVHVVLTIILIITLPAVIKIILIVVTIVTIILTHNCLSLGVLDSLKQHFLELQNFLLGCHGNRSEGSFNWHKLIEDLCCCGLVGMGVLPHLTAIHQLRWYGLHREGSS
jgi:hypothetical protein